MPDFDEQYDSYAMWEHSGKFEGDIVLTQQIERNGIISDSEKWKNREIPYELDPIFDDFDAAWIRECLGEISRKTCLNVRPKVPEDMDYIHVISGQGCYSLIGRVGGRQELSLRRNLTGVGCLRSGTIIHEFLHAAGFFHQHSSPDRDQYIQIIGENVVEGNL
ncbi:discoidin cub egf laminin and zinc metalloprotease domain containing [Holotrichia oblita]|uniref:Discoidin cub egf laminin and zinc metalloprotease domain containing n=1 Tax=Holotrichia oblita TaxID=644536 RepID=A0ACB9SRL0_HOLOL|nr:discoidin cub egf laminin and zinc metalloprotease domain containing [Holotrichia oblita]